MGDVKIFLGLVCGAVLGTVLGIAVAMGMAILIDGSAGIAVIETAPFGCIIGAWIGAVMTARRLK